MASAGTLLSDLDGKSPVFSKDDDLVNNDDALFITNEPPAAKWEFNIEKP
jgi:hypothetical protein